jgi:hypothetical protein
MYICIYIHIYIYNVCAQDVARPAFLRLPLGQPAAFSNFLSGRAVVVPSEAGYLSRDSSPFLTLTSVPKPGDTLRWARGCTLSTDQFML